MVNETPDIYASVKVGTGPDWVVVPAGVLAQLTATCIAHWEQDRDPTERSTAYSVPMPLVASKAIVHQWADDDGYWWIHLDGDPFRDPKVVAARLIEDDGTEHEIAQATRDWLDPASPRQWSDRL